jgi:hypothetical protein
MPHLPDIPPPRPTPWVPLLLASALSLVFLAGLALA